MKLEFPLQIFEKTQTSNFMKISPVRAEFFNADVGTDLTKLIVTYRNFANAIAPEDIQPVKHPSSFSSGNSTLVLGAVTQQSVDEECEVLHVQLSTFLHAHSCTSPIRLRYNNKIVEGGVGYATKL